MPDGCFRTTCGPPFSRRALRWPRRSCGPPSFISRWCLFAGLRQARAAQLNPFDLVVLLSLSNTVQNAIIGNDNSLSGGLIGAFASWRSTTGGALPVPAPPPDQIFEGKPTTLIEGGRMLEKELAKELLTRGNS